MFPLPKQRVTICARVGTPEKVAVDDWLKSWMPFLQCTKFGCPCVDIYRVEAVPDQIERIPPGVIVANDWMDLADLEDQYCQCVFHALSETGRRWFETALEAHDRLWDREITISELRALYSAAENALHDTPHRAEFEAVLQELDRLMRSEKSADEQRDWACGSTDDFRQYIGRQLSGKLRNRATPCA